MPIIAILCTPLPVSQLSRMLHPVYPRFFPDPVDPAGRSNDQFLGSFSGMLLHPTQGMVSVPEAVLKSAHLIPFLRCVPSVYLEYHEIAHLSFRNRISFKYFFSYIEKNQDPGRCAGTVEQHITYLTGSSRHDCLMKLIGNGIQHRIDPWQYNVLF